MSDQERIAVEELIRSGPDLAGGTLDEVRANYELMGQITPLAPGVTVEPAEVGGIPGEYLIPRARTAPAPSCSSTAAAT